MSSFQVVAEFRDQDDLSLQYNLYQEAFHHLSLFAGELINLRKHFIVFKCQYFSG